MINKQQLSLRKTRRWMIALLMMVSTVTAIGQTTYYSKASATNFNDVNSWGTATDGTGTSPAAISNADNFIIQNAAALSLSANADVRQLTINAGSLSIAANTLTVAIGVVNNAILTVATGGTLTVSGGTLTVNGQFNVSGTGALNQSGGTIIVDGNGGGVTANSVSGSIVNFTSSTLTFSGGMFQVVDPHQGTGRAFSYNTTSGVINASANHTFWFGSLTSTDAGGSATDGFLVNTYVGSGRFHFGSFTHGGSTGTNRHITFTYNTGVLGNLVIETGGDLRTPTTFYVKGNVTVNTGGTLSVTNTLALADFTGSSTTLASTVAQTIGGAGTYRNFTASPTANMYSFTVNNTNASGVTINTPLTVSSTLTLTAGVINTTAVNSLRLGTATAAGTLTGGSSTAYINGPFMRTFASSRTATGTYTATTLFPVGKGGSYLPAWLDPTTSSGGAVIISGEAFNTNSGSAGSGVLSVSTSRWEGLIVSGAANLTGAFVQLGDGTSITAAKTILQAPSAAGAYSATPSATTFTAGTPNTIRTNTIIPVASLTGYLSYGELPACAVPASQASAFTASAKTNTAFTGSFTASASLPTGYLVVRYASGATPTTPVNTTIYAAAASLGTGTVVGSITTTTFAQTGLTANTTYDYYIYAYNNQGCSGPVYNTVSPLTASVTTCAAAIGIPASASGVAITTSSFTARWGRSSTAGATYEFDLSTSSTFASFVPGYQALPLVDTFINLSGLNTATLYYYRARAISTGGCTSSLSTATTVQTLCNPTTSITENFATVTTPAFPVCWTKVSTTGTASTQTADASSAPNCLYIYSSSATDIAVVSLPPLSNAGAGTHWLKFKARANFTVGGVIQVGYLTIPGDASSFVSVQPVTISALTYQNYTVDPGVAPGANTTIAFRHTGSPANSVLIDDVIWEPRPSCLSPVIAPTIVTGATTATVRWKGISPAPASGYEIYVSTSNTPPTTANSFSPVDTFVGVGGLTPATKHFAWVRSNCAGSGTSTWSLADSFFTYCNPASALSENFASITVPALPICWTKISTTGSVSTQAANSSSAPNCLYIYSGSTTDIAVVSLPPVNNASAGTHWLTFRGRANATVGGVIQVGYLTSPSDPASFVSMQAFTMSTLTYQTYSIDPGVAPGANTTLAFRHTGSPANSVLIDDVIWEPKPSCLSPVIAPTIVTGSTTATVRWKGISPAPASGYEIYVSTSNTPPTTANSFSPVDTFVAVGGLTPATKHFAWVRSNCAGSGTSTWSLADSFFTFCNATTVFPYIENFNAATAGTLPVCITTENVNNDAGIWNTIVAPATPAGYTGNVMRYNFNGTNAANDWFYTNGLSLSGGVSYRLKFSFGNNDATYIEKLRVMYGTAAASGSMTNLLFDSATITGNTFKTATVDFTPSVSGTYYIGFKAYSAANQWNLYVDDISVDFSPSCIDPIISPAIVTGSSTATLRWKGPLVAPAGGYDIYVSTSSTAPTSLTIPTHFSPVDTFYALSSLPSATKHYAWVRSNCGGSGLSGWSLADIFTTFCSPVTSLPYIENFNGVTAGSFPACTNTENVNNDDGVWTTAAAPTAPAGYSGNVLRYTYSEDFGANDWFFTAPVNLNAGTTYRLKFNFGNNSASFSEKLRVMYGTSNTNGAMTTLLFDSANVTGNTFQSASINFIPSTSGTFFIGFKAYSLADEFYLYVDDINLDVAPNCIEPVIAKTIVTGTSTATVRWKAPLSAPTSGYDVYVSTSNTAPTNLTTPTAFSPIDTFVAVSGLNAATRNFAWVRSNCGGLGTSAWSLVDSFTTLCNAATTLSENFSTVTVPALPICWSKVTTTGGGSTQTADASSAPNCLYIYSSSTTDIGMVSLPPVSNAGAGTHWLKLKARANFTVGGVIQVGYLTTPGAAASFVPVQSFTASTLTYQTYTIDLGVAPGANTILALRHTGSPANSVLIDDVIWEVKPNCIDPVIATTILTTPTTAVIRWKGLTSAPASGYDVYLSTNNTAPTNLSTPTHFAPTDTFVSISGLPVLTQHFAWVRSNCGGSGTSAWSLADSFTTNILINSLPYSQDFESNNGGWTSAIVSGTGNDWAFGTPSKTVINGAHSGTKAWVTKLTGSYSNNTNAAVVSPTFDLSTFGTAPILRFHHKFVTEAGYDAAVVEISINGGTWTRLDSTLGTGTNFNTPNSYAWYNNSSTNGNITPRKFSGASSAYASASTGWIQSATYLTGAAGQSNVRIRFRFNSETTSVEEGWAIDDIEIVEAPAVAPFSASSVITTPSNTSSFVNWMNGNGDGRIVVARLTTTAAVAPTDFKLYTGNANFSAAAKDSTGPGNYVVYNGTLTNMTVTGLTALTNYSFDVYEYNGKYMHVKFALPGTANTTTTPVKLLTFEGVNTTGDVDLTWATASERNNAGFDVERSTDGKHFEKVSFVKGAGNSSVRLRYAYTDARAFAKTGAAKLYYRLKQIDADNTSEYSKVISVTETGITEFSVTAFPVPFSTDLTINVNSLQQVNGTITVVDLQGKTVHKQTISLSEGTNNVSLSGLNDLDAGVYFVKVEQNNQTKVIRVVKSN